MIQTLITDFTKISDDTIGRKGAGEGGKQS